MMREEKLFLSGFVCRLSLADGVALGVRFLVEESENCSRTGEY